MDYKFYESRMNELATWVLRRQFQGSTEDCPHIGHLGYLNGMTRPELITVYTAKDILKADGKNWKDYFTYDVDSSD